MAETAKSRKSITTVVIILILLAAGGCAAKFYVFRHGFLGEQRSIKSSQYQAVFLSNGQVYFGKLANVSKNSLKLTDIYYLQVQQSVQPAGGDKDSTPAQTSPNVSLAKLGSELHGPEDVMYINRDQVLFWENLKDDSKVVTAIKENKKK